MMGPCQGPDESSILFAPILLWTVELKQIFYILNYSAELDAGSTVHLKSPHFTMEQATQTQGNLRALLQKYRDHPYHFGYPDPSDWLQLNTGLKGRITACGEITEEELYPWEVARFAHTP
jgi:hypothetical protein